MSMVKQFPSIIYVLRTCYGEAFILAHRFGGGGLVMLDEARRGGTVIDSVAESLWDAVVRHFLSSAAAALRCL